LLFRGEEVAVEGLVVALLFFLVNPVMSYSH